MNVNDFNVKSKSSKNHLDIIKNMSINQSDLSIHMSPKEDIQPSSSINSIKNRNFNYNNFSYPNNIQNMLNVSSNSNYSSEDQNNFSDEEGKIINNENLSDSNNNSDINNNNYDISNNYQNFGINDEQDKLILIKKQNDKIDELFNLLESRDKEIYSLQNENNSLYKYKNDCKILEQNNFDKINIIKKYEQSLQIGNQEIKNVNDELLKYKNISNDLNNNLNSLNKEYENLMIINQQLTKKINMLEKQNKLSNDENNKSLNKINILEEKNNIMKNENKNMEAELKKLMNINKNLEGKLKENEYIIMQLKNENPKLIKELKEIKEKNILNEQKINYYKETNNNIMNEMKENNQKEINLKSYVAEIIEYFSKQILNLLNKSEFYMQNINNENNINENDNVFNNYNIELNLKANYSNILKEIPTLSKFELLFNEMKKFIDLFLGNYSKLKISYDNKITSFNNTLNNMNNNILELNSKLVYQKEENNLLLNKSRNKMYEINKNISDLNNNNNKISIKFKMLKDFIYGFYNNIVTNYNDISSKVYSKGKMLLSKKEPKIYNDNSSTDFDNENNIKEIIIESERIFNNLIEYTNYLGEELNKLSIIEKNNFLLKNEKMELVKNINKLKNELNMIKVDNQNQANNLRIKYDLNLKEKIQNLENKNNEMIKLMNEQMKKKEDEIINVNKNYNLLYNQYKLLIKNNSLPEN